MEFLDPSEFDVIVLGSGLPESLIASAAAKGGKKVLLIDPDETYGGSWSTRNLNQFLEAAAGSNSSSSTARAAGTALPELDSSEPQPQTLLIEQSSMSISMCTRLIDPDDSQQGHARDYLVDSCPKVLFQGEPLVDLLVRSKVHNYMDFRSVDSSVIAHEGAFSPVPATRSDIFKSKKLSLQEKRHLMQFLNKCLSAIDNNTHVEGWAADAALTTILEEAHLSPQLVNAISYGIALADQHPSELSAIEGQKALQLYMESYNKFGSPAAFMLPVYGAGTLVEGFIRSSAVHSAVTVLRHPVSCLLMESPSQQEGSSPHCTGLRAENGQELRAKLLVANCNYLRPHITPGSAQITYVNRALLLTDQPLLEGSDCVSAVCPPGSMGSNTSTIRLLQVGAGLQVAPRNKFLVYCSAVSDAIEDPVAHLKPVLDALFDLQHLRPPVDDKLEVASTTAAQNSQESTTQCNDPLSAPTTPPLAPTMPSSKPRVLQAIFFKQEVIRRVNCPSLPSNVACCPSGDAAFIGYSSVLEETEQLFRKHLPDLTWWGDVELEEFPDVGLDEDEEDVLQDLMSAVGSLSTQANDAPVSDDS